MEHAHVCVRVHARARERKKKVGGLGLAPCCPRGIHTLVIPEGGFTAAPQQSRFSDFVGAPKTFLKGFFKVI